MIKYGKNLVYSVSAHSAPLFPNTSLFPFLFLLFHSSVIPSLHSSFVISFCFSLLLFLASSLVLSFTSFSWHLLSFAVYQISSESVIGNSADFNISMNFAGQDFSKDKAGMACLIPTPTKIIEALVGRDLNLKANKI